MHLQDEYHDGTVRRFSFVDFEFHMEPKLQASINRDTGTFYKQHGLLNKAVGKYDQALDIKAECYKSLYEKSRCNLEMGLPDVALVDADNCIELHPDKIYIKNYRNMCLFELNDFEESLVAYEKTRTFKTKKSELEKRDVVHTVINTMIGPEQGPCLLNNRKNILKYDEYRRAQQIDERPIWKVLKEQGACDVVSTLEVPIKEISKRRYLRNQRKRSNLLSLYFGLPTAADYQFLEKLNTDNRLFLTQTQCSNNQNQQTINTALKELNTYENMLHARAPLYAARSKANSAEGKAFTEKSLFRIQLKTRKETFAHLVEIKRLAAANQIIELSKYVEDVNSNFIHTKTLRVLPRKFEIVSEIFNIVGIAYLRNVTTVPPDCFGYPHSEQLYALFRVPHLKKGDDGIHNVLGVFGDKNTYVDPEEPDRVYLKYKKRVSALEKKLRHCRLTVESCYIYYELSCVHIDQGQIDEPKILAARIVELADERNNIVWKMLGLFIFVRTDLCQMVMCRRNLNRMFQLRHNFDEQIKHFIDTAILLDERDAMKRNG